MPCGGVAMSARLVGVDAATFDPPAEWTKLYFMFALRGKGGSWALKKQQVHARSGGSCERCRNAPATNVHHESYRFLGDEPLEDLIDLCEPCHEFEHGRSRFDPAVSAPVLNEHAWQELMQQPWFRRMLAGTE